MQRRTLLLILAILVVVWLAAGDGRRQIAQVARAVSDAVRKLTAGEERKRAELLPQARAALDAFRAALAARGVETQLGETYRSDADQAAQHAAGRSDIPKTGWHGVRRAFHLYPRVGGQADVRAKREDLVRLMHDLAPQFGLTGIAYHADGRKKLLSSGAWDAHHFEFREGLSLAAAIAQERARGGKALA